MSNTDSQRLDAMRRQRDGYRNQLRKTEQQTNRHEPTKEETMTSKTFEGVDGTRLLHIKNLGKHVTMSIEVPGQVHMGITFDPASIPALALAELEAAGWPERESTSVTRTILSDLSRVVEFQERVTAEAKEQAELEAEALELLNVVREARGIKPHLIAGEASPEAMNEWLAVARRAREINKEEK